MSGMNWSNPRGSQVNKETCARINRSGGKKEKKGKWERGAMYTLCSHYVAEAWCPTKNKGKIVGRCPNCRRQADLGLDKQPVSPDNL